MKRSRQALFLGEQGGMTGAEKALVLCFALGILALSAALVSRGSDRAARDARGALQEGLGAGARLDDVVRPLHSARATVQEGAASGLRSVGSLTSFSSDYKNAPGAPESAPPQPAPLPPPQRDLIVTRSRGSLTAVAIQRTGLLPPQDPVLQVLRDALDNHGIDPGTPHATVTVWTERQGGTATMDRQGNVLITNGNRRVIIFRDGALQVVTPTANRQFDTQGRLHTYALLGQRGTTSFLTGSYAFTYSPDGQPTRVQVLGGPHEGTWTRGPNGQWTNERGQPWNGPDPPGTWAQILAGHARLTGITAAAMQAIDNEMQRLRGLWQPYFSGELRTFRNIVGSGFSGNIGEMHRLAEESGALRTQVDELRQLQARIAASQDPAEIARLARQFSQRATALRDRIDRFRNDSARVVGASMQAGRAWGIAQDVYGLGTASGSLPALWNLSKLIKDVVGD